MAISNRYGRKSEISIVNNNDWSVYTFLVMDLSEPGLTELESWEVETPDELLVTLNEIKNFESQLVHVTERSLTDSGTRSYSPSLKSAPQLKEIKVSIPRETASSVIQLYDSVGALLDTNTYIRSQVMPIVTNVSIWQRIFSQTKGYVIVAIFDDKSTINFSLILTSSTIAWDKVDSTAMMADGKRYDHYGETKYISSPYIIDMELGRGPSSFIVNGFKTCVKYTKTSSGGTVWKGTICYYTYEK